MKRYVNNGDIRSKDEYLQFVFSKMNICANDYFSAFLVKESRKRDARHKTLVSLYNKKQKRIEASLREIRLRPNTITRKKKGKKK